MGRLLGTAVAAGLAVLAAPLLAPQVLAFPYKAQSHGSQVWSETPLPQAALDRVLDRTSSLVAQSPIADPQGETRHIFLTDGGWRWTWLALQNRKSFAVSRGFVGTVIINRGDIAADRIFLNSSRAIDGVRIGGRRTVSGTLAHEFCHGMELQRFGPMVDMTTPRWLREGYCDHVAQESTLTAGDVARLRAAGQSHPALLYYEGRRRVEAILARNGGNVDKLFRE